MRDLDRPTGDRRWSSSRRDRDCLAPEGIPPVLDVEDPAREARQGGGPERGSAPVRALIRRLCRDNPLRGAPRVHGELLKLGIDIGETSVSKLHGPPPETALTNLADVP